MDTGDEQALDFCDGCCKDVKEKTYEFYCRTCKNTVHYCKTCLSVATKQNKCIDCYEEEG